MAVVWSGGGFVQIGVQNVVSTLPTLAYDGTNTISANSWGFPLFAKSNDLTYSFQLSCPATGSPNGSIALQGTNDFSQFEGADVPDSTLVNWSALGFWDEATTSWVLSKAVAGAQSYMFTIPVVGARWVRAVWTNTSGTALLTMTYQSKSARA